MAVKQKIKVKTFTGSGSFNVRDEMLKDSKDLLDNVEVTTVAQECAKLKQKEDEIAALEEQLKTKKGFYDNWCRFWSHWYILIAVSVIKIRIQNLSYERNMESRKLE